MADSGYFDFYHSAQFDGGEEFQHKTLVYLERIFDIFQQLAICG